MSAAGGMVVVRIVCRCSPNHGFVQGLRTIDRPIALDHELWVLLYEYTTPQRRIGQSCAFPDIRWLGFTYCPACDLRQHCGMTPAFPSPRVSTDRNAARIRTSANSWTRCWLPSVSPRIRISGRLTNAPAVKRTCCASWPPCAQGSRRTSQVLTHAAARGSGHEPLMAVSCWSVVRQSNTNCVCPSL